MKTEYRKTLSGSLRRRVGNGTPQLWSKVSRRWIDSVLDWDEIKRFSEFCSAVEALEIIERGRKK